MRFLLDVNVLLALMDPAHVSHADAHRWFAEARKRGWATCPLTQNGAVRIASHPPYPNSPGSPAAVGAILGQFAGDARHEFWPDDLSLLDTTAVNLPHVTRSGDVTDTYLLALAVRHGGSLATFDARIRTNGVPDGAKSVVLIPSK